MFRLDVMACARLSPEAQMVSEIFLGALPPFARRHVRSIRLFGAQARRYDPEAPFDMLVLVDTRNVEVKTALAIASAAVEQEAQASIFTTLVTSFERDTASGALARTIQNAVREGVDLWSRELETARLATFH